MNEKINCRKAVILLIGVTCLVLFAGLGFRELESGDETRVAGIAAETFLEGNYLVPRLNGTPFLEYPPLGYWMTAGTYALFGINDFAAKLPSALAAFGMVMLTFAFARKLKFSICEALFSGLVLLFSSQFFSESRTCRVDMLLAFFIELSLFSFYSMTEIKAWRTRFAYWGLFTLGLAGGIYTKGLIGIVLPSAVFGCWLYLYDFLHAKVSGRMYIEVFFGGLFALGLAGIWYFLLWHYEGKALFDTAFWTNNLGRFTGSQSDHAESIFYYVIKLPTLFLPWLPILLFALIAAFRRIREEKNPALLLLMLAILIPFALLCIASGKRIVYLLPLSAPCALLTGWYFGHLPSVITKYLERIPLRKTAMPVLIVMTVAVIGIDIGTALHMNRKKSLHPLFEHCVKLEQQGRKLYLIDASERTRGAAYFYLHHTLPEKSSDSGNPGNNEFGIVRDKKMFSTGKKFADHHAVIGG